VKKGWDFPGGGGGKAGEIENCSNYLLEICWANESRGLESRLLWLRRESEILCQGLCHCCGLAAASVVCAKRLCHLPQAPSPAAIIYRELCQAFGFVLICDFNGYFYYFFFLASVKCKLRKVLPELPVVVALIYNYNNATESGLHLKPF